MRIAMWSGPRNISTAMMRSFGNRSDTYVCDEPLYAYYLTQREVDHPGIDEVTGAHETDWRKVVDWLTGPIPGGKAVFYQKQMSHHLLPEIDRDWLDRVRNCFLIRDPAAMLRSLSRKMTRPTVADTGLEQQVEVFAMVRERTGTVPPVVDAADILTDPRGILSRLCAAIDLPFDDTMLTWPAGRRETDGVWAKHWYAEVEKTTGFRPYQPRAIEVPAEHRALYEECLGLYRVLHEHRITA